VEQHANELEKVSASALRYVALGNEPALGRPFVTVGKLPYIALQQRAGVGRNATQSGGAIPLGQSPGIAQNEGHASKGVCGIARLCGAGDNDAGLRDNRSGPPFDIVTDQDAVTLAVNAIAHLRAKAAQLAHG
jgi:hypothetical protein